jgi:hypothetical protein
MNPHLVLALFVAGVMGLGLFTLLGLWLLTLLLDGRG